MMDSNLSELIIYSIGCSFALVSVLAACVCGCRKGNHKNDLLGLDGMVKITNPDENVNHLPSVGNYTSQNSDQFVTESDEHFKRPPGGSNPHRSLPDIPISADGDIRMSENGVSGDTSSELYATVDDKTIIAYNKRHTLPNGVETGPSLSHQSSISQSDSNYARLKENPYDKVKKSENPYANVKSDNKENDESSREPSPRSSWNNITRISDSTDTVDQSILERGRRPSGQGSLNAIGNSSPTPDIPAATAVAGRIAASQDLPYMTPPITQPQHFSGDSQDSSRGYTSISVREPLANIMSQMPVIRNRRNLDPHYSTVSDDSDDMYAAIIEPNSNIYNGSETYAQIQPVTVAEVHNPASDLLEDEDDQYEPAPQPPSVDSLKHVAHVHSRQASSSSCTSSVANLGSPKPEKRQANSPLPPPPAVSPDLYSRIDKTEEIHNNLSVVRNLEDMYAKVHKTKRKHDEAKPSTSEMNESHGETPKSKKSYSSRDSFEDFKNLETSTNFDGESLQNCKSLERASPQEHCYETLNKNDKKLSRKSWGPSQCSGPDSLLSNDPGYEQLNPQNRAPSDCDPNYEILRPHRTNSVNSDSSVGYSKIQKQNKSTLTVKHTVPQNPLVTEDGYSIVNKNKKIKPDPGYEEIHKIIDEPNYESMPSEIIDDNYATINKSTESESDPNYESVKYLDVALKEPPYERLQDDESNAKGSSDLSDNKSSTPDYERIKSSDNSDHSDKSHLKSSGSSDRSDRSHKSIPDYERIKSSENSEDRSDSHISTPDYERIKEAGSKTSIPDFERVKTSSENSEERSDSKLSGYISTPDYERIKDASKSSENSDDRLSNNEDILVEQASIILTVTQDINEVKITIPNASKETENDIFHV